MSLVAEPFEAETVTDDEFVNATDEPDTDSDPPGEEPEPTTEAEEVTDGPARDEQGRFAKKDKDDGESEEPATSEVDAAPTTETPEIPAAATEDTPAAEDDPGEPLVFKVSGKEYTLEGAKLFKDGLYVPTEQVENAKRAIAEGTYYRQNWQSLEKQATDKGYQRALAEAPEIKQAKAMMAQLEPLLADPDAAANFLSDFHTNAPVLRANAMRAMAEAELEQLRSGAKQQQETGQREQLEQQKSQTLSETMSDLKAHPETKLLTKEDWIAIDRQVTRLNQRNALFVERNGETYLDVPAIEEIAMDVLSARKVLVESAKKAEEALKFNAANRPKPNGKPASAAVAPRKGGAPKPAEAKRDSRDVVNDFMSEKLDFDD